MEDLNTLKRNIADNLIFYRKQKGLTQLDIAEKLNYSDKAVSKWERAEAIPDVYTLKQIADFYGITLDDLLSDDKKKREKIVKTHEDKSRIIKLFTTILSCGLVGCLAVLIFILPEIFAPEITKSWIIFIYALTIDFILLVVFSCLWAKRIYKFFSISGLVWSVFLTICLTVHTFNGNARIWLLMIVAFCLQIMVLLWFGFAKALISKLIKTGNKEK